MIPRRILIAVIAWHLSLSLSGAITVSNIAPTGITATAAWFSGNLSATNGSTNTLSVRLCYGTSDGSTNLTWWGYTNHVLYPATTGAISTNVTSLSATTLYYYRWYALEGTNAAWSTPSTSFWTTANTPTSASPAAAAWPLMVDSNGLILFPTNFWPANTSAMAAAGIALDLDLNDATQRIAYIEALTGKWETVWTWWGGNTGDIAYALSRTSTWDSVAAGYQSGALPGGSGNNVWVGYFAGIAATGAGNTYVGFDAGDNSDGDYNSFIGDGVGRDSTVSNSAVLGRWAGRNAVGVGQLFLDAYSVEPDVSHNPINDMIWGDDGDLYLGRPSKTITLRGTVSIPGFSQCLGA